MSAKNRSARKMLPILIGEGLAVILLTGVLIVFVRAYVNLRPSAPVAGSTHASIERIAAATLSRATLEAAMLSPAPKVTAGPAMLATPSETPEAGEGPTLEPTQTLRPTFTLTATATPIPLTGRIVFTCTPGEFNQLCMINADGSGWRQLISQRAHFYYPSFAPDGKSIVYASNQTGQFEVYSLDLETNEESQITLELGNTTAPEVSPDGKWIVFALKFFNDSSIWLIERDGNNAHALTDDEHNEIDPTWSPDGKQIAFAGVRGGYVELYVMNADGSHIQPVTRNIQRIGGRSSWSPDGKRLVFYAGPKDDRDVYIIDIATSALTRLTSGGNNTGPCFSPDGEWIVFSSSRDGDHDIYIMRPDGSDVRQLTHNSYDDWQPRWGP
jgi:TolB protein